MDFDETVGNEEHIKGVIATDIARACGGAISRSLNAIPRLCPLCTVLNVNQRSPLSSENGLCRPRACPTVVNRISHLITLTGPVDKIKVRSLREGPVIADLILCQGLHPDGKSPLEIFEHLKAQENNAESLLKHGEVTSKTVQLRLKKGYSKNEPRKANNLKLLQGVPRMMLDLEQVLEGMEGALADPVSLGNDPTMYAPEQERPSSAVAAQLRPLLSVARTRFGADMAENPLDFSHINKLHNKFRKATHETRDDFFGDGPPLASNIPGSHLSAAKGSQSPPGSPMSQQIAAWKVEVPVPSPLPKPAPVPSPMPPAANVKIGSKREQVEQHKLIRHQSQRAQSSWRQQGMDPLDGQGVQASAEERDQEFMRQRAAYLEQNSRKASQNAFGSQSAFGVANKVASNMFVSTSAMNTVREGMPGVDKIGNISNAAFDPMSAKAAMRSSASYNR
jgi:hypothetical protein